MKKEVLSVILMAALTLAGSIGYTFAGTGDVPETDSTAVAAASLTTENISFSDVTSGKWYYDTVTKMAQAGALNGYSDGTFKPDSTVTRAEFTKICVAFLDGEQEAVSGGSWYVNYMNRAEELGIIPAAMRHSTSAECNSAISREDMTAMVELCSEKILEETMEEADSDTLSRLQKKKITDYKQINVDYRDIVYSAYIKGFVTGMTDTEFSPLGNATRAQAATMIARLTDESMRIDNMSELENKVPENTSSITVNPKGGNAADIKIGNGAGKYTVMSAEDFLKQYSINYVIFSNSNQSKGRTNYGTSEDDSVTIAIDSDFFNLGVSCNGTNHDGLAGYQQDVIALPVFDNTYDLSIDVDFYYFEKYNENSDSGSSIKNRDVIVITDDLYGAIMKQVKADKVPIYESRVVHYDYDSLSEEIPSRCYWSEVYPKIESGYYEWNPYR